MHEPDGLAVVEAEHATRRVLNEVAAERRRQDAKWGEQDLPDGTGNYDGHGAERTLRVERAQRRTERHARNGTLTWKHILLEEVCEVRAEDDPVRLRIRLVRVAARAVAWIEAIDRRAEEKRP